jgi:hypothetical protein
VSPEAETALNAMVHGTATIGTIVAMNAGDISSAFHNDLGVSTAIIVGINAGLSGRHF